MDPVKPKLRGWLHAVAFAASFPAGMMLVSAAGDKRAFLSSLIYVTCLAIAFGVSAIYHRCAIGGHWFWRLRRVDHSAVFLLIAGTYTPVCVLSLQGTLGFCILVAEWVGAAVGILLVLILLEKNRNVTDSMYVLLGWLALLGYVQLRARFSLSELLLLFGGGTLYTVGGAIYRLKRPNPWPRVFGSHEVWHTFMTSAAVCHWSLIYRLVTAAH